MNTPTTPAVPFIIHCADGRRFFVPLPPALSRSEEPETRVAKTIRLNPDTNRKLRLAKQKLNMMSDTAVIEQALRLLFRKENIE